MVNRDINCFCDHIDNSHDRSVYKTYVDMAKKDVLFTQLNLHFQPPLHINAAYLNKWMTAKFVFNFSTIWSQFKRIELSFTMK